MEGEAQRPWPSPSPASANPPSAFLRDISNFKTPKRPSQNPNLQSPQPQQFFTASKQTPSSSSSSFRRRPSFAPSASRSKASAAAARRLKAFELEQSQSARKVQIKKERSLKSLSKSLTAWLNFLLENPGSCGCDPSGNGGSGRTGKRENGLGDGVGVGTVWRSPKRQRDCSWRGEDFESLALPTSMFAVLESSLRDVCSFDDLKQRMRVYLSLGNCKEIFKMMTQVTKNIDEGRIKMKAHCPIVTDVGMKEKAVKMLMCYNPIWLRIGLYIIFGGDSLLPDGDVNSEQEMAFLKMVIEKQFFSHAGLAKNYAYNKLVDGLYRAGYFETLGNVILKRFLLLVLMLDRAKTQGSLPLEYGIDGVDGGSPLLFIQQSSIKSSCQMINDFLSTDAMHGQGNLIAHLLAVGYKVSHQQAPLIEYDFNVTDLFEDLRDGVRVSRVIQILQRDSSILLKLVVPSDTRKKNLQNCGIALRYLKEAGVQLHDEDGMVISAQDLVNGDKELTLSLLWNIFVHLQLPLLINKTLLREEIQKIREVDADLPDDRNSTCLDILIIWIQVVCSGYDIRVDNFASLVDGKAMWCLLDYYFRTELPCACSYQHADEVCGKTSIVSDTDETDAVYNFILSQKLMMLLGKFPEVLQISDILENNGACNDQTVVILLGFLASQLVVKKNVDELNFHKLLACKCQCLDRKPSSIARRYSSYKAIPIQEEIDDSSITYGDAATATKFKAIQAWWQDMAERNYKSQPEPNLFSESCILNGKPSADIQENAARRSTEHHNFSRTKNAASILQTAIVAWLTAKQISDPENFCRKPRVQELPCERLQQSELFRRYVKFMFDRHRYMKVRRSILCIQRAVRIWISRRQQGKNILTCKTSPDPANAAGGVQTYNNQLMPCPSSVDRVPHIQNALPDEERDLSDLLSATIKMQVAWRKYIASKTLRNKNAAATKIQCSFSCWWHRRSFMNQRHAALKIQTQFRCFINRSAFKKHKTAMRSAIIIQSYVRRWIVRRQACRLKYLIIAVQRHFRAWLIRKHYLLQKKAMIKIQSAQRCLNCLKAFRRSKHAAVEIQSFIRGQIIRNRLLGASSLTAATHGDWLLHTSTLCSQSLELSIFCHSVLKLQRWWRGVCVLKAKENAAIMIQSHIRGQIARRKAQKDRHHVVVVQSCWRGYLVRKKSGQLSDLRWRLQRSAANVDDSKRIINRLLVALSELQGMRSVSCILHTCATLDMATQYSQKCCEELVAAGAIDNLLKLIMSVSRSIPDQEVLKHALSTLRNLARYLPLVDILIASRGSVETVLLEFLRNKQEGYFIASELLKRICSRPKGVEAVRNKPALLKRLQKTIDDLTRRADNERRNARGVPARGQTERRLKEAIDLLNIVMNGGLES